MRHRDRSRQELERRLDRAGISAAEQADTLETLERVGYVDDGRFAAGRAASLADRGYGDAAIRHDLEERAVGEEEIATALAALPPEPERARDLVARLGATPKTAGQLARKGFDADSIEAALGADVAPDGS